MDTTHPDTPAPPPWRVLELACAELRHLQPADHGGCIHPSAVINGVLELGEGSIVKPGTVIEGHVRIGSHCTIGPRADALDGAEYLE